MVSGRDESVRWTTGAIFHRYLMISIERVIVRAILYQASANVFRSAVHPWLLAVMGHTGKFIILPNRKSKRLETIAQMVSQDHNFDTRCDIPSFIILEIKEAIQR